MFAMMVKDKALGSQEAGETCVAAIKTANSCTGRGLDTGKAVTARSGGDRLEALA